MKQKILAFLRSTWSNLVKGTDLEKRKLRPYHSPAKRIQYVEKIKNIEKRSLREHGLTEYAKAAKKQLSKKLQRNEAA